MPNSGPGLLVGNHMFSSVEFNGTLFIDTDQDDDFVGLVFNYQSNKRFMLVTWKRNDNPYYVKYPFPAEARAGLEIKVVKSQSGPGKMLRNAIWHSGKTRNEVMLRSVVALAHILNTMHE